MTTKRESETQSDLSARVAALERAFDDLCECLAKFLPEGALAELAALETSVVTDEERAE
jgi:hypothetical protein